MELPWEANLQLKVGENWRKSDREIQETWAKVVLKIELYLLHKQYIH